MHRILLVFTILLGYQLAVPPPIFGSDDLLEAARKAQARRRKVDKNKKGTTKDQHGVMTNTEIKETTGGNVNQTGRADSADAKPADGTASSTETSAVAEPTADAAKSADAAKPADAEKPVEEAKDEGYWRERLQGAEAAVVAARQKLADLNAGINESRRGSSAIDDPNIQQQKRQEQLQKQGELQGAQQAVKDAEQAVTSVREEARRAGAPPGWLR